MAEKTMHHAVIGADTFELVDQSARADVSDLKNALLINTRNLFDSDAIELQKNTVGDSASKRAISGRAFVGTGNKFTVKAHNLPSNLKYQIISYTGTALSTFQSSYTSWITNTDAATITATKDYMAVLFGTVNDNDITKNDFSGLKLQVELGVNSTEFVPFQVANDVIAREGVTQNSSEIEKTTSRINSFMTTTRNLFNPYGVLLGYIAPGNPNSTRAISGLIDIGTGNAFSVKATNLPANLKYETVPYQDETTGKDAYTSWITDSTVLSRSASYRYVRILFGTVNGNDITKNDFIGLKIQVELGDVTAWVPYKVPCDAIMRELVGSGVEEIRLMEYNIGHYCYGTGSSVADIGLPAEQYADKLQGMIEFFGKYQPDILCMCEYWEYLDNAKQHPSDSTLFDWLYPYKYESAMWNAIKSNYQLSNKTNQALTAKSSTYAYKADFNIGGKLVSGLVVHFPVVNATAEDRQAEMNAAITLMADCDRAFICGDFNCDTDEERDALFAIAKTAGYTLANGGLFGWKKTYNYTTQVSYLDNILVKGNIKVKDFQVLTSEVGNLCSDHIPIYADLLVY